MMLSAGAKLGPYEVQSLLGSGGMGEVYRARDTRLDRTVAIKVLPQYRSSDPQRRQRFDREARAISALNHPNICQLYDVGSPRYLCQREPVQLAMYSRRKHSSLGNSVANVALIGEQVAGNIPAQRNCIGRVVIGKASQN